MSPLRVTFVLPFLHPTGGVRLVLDYAAALERRGYRARVVYPTCPYRFQFTRCQQFREWRARITEGEQPWWRSESVRVQQVPLVRTPFLPPADVVVATSWPTVADVVRLSATRGRKVHLLMHHESGTGPSTAIERTFRAPVHRVVLSERIRAELTARLGLSVATVVPAGIDGRVFFPEPVAREHRTVLMFYHVDPRKGATVGLEAVERLRRRVGDVRLVLCGCDPPATIPTDTVFVARPTDGQLRRLYSRATALLYPSRYEGFGLPPLEAMACGCPVVTTNVGAVPDFTANGRYAIVVEPDDVPGLAAGLEEICTSSPRRAILERDGPGAAARWSIESAAARLADTLVRVCMAGEHAVCERQ